MKFFQFLFLILIFPLCLLSQDRNAIWTFGDGAGINFNDLLNPVPIISSVNSRGTCASISDAGGNLKFYCAAPDIDAYRNGILPTGIVYNRFHQKMQNSDSLISRGWYHEMVIVPSPGDTNFYYIFHTGVTSLSGLYYSIIDMTLDSGKGAVVSKNNQLRTEFAVDCIQAVKNGNGRDWWLIYKHVQQSNNLFFVYSISPNGVILEHIDSVGLNGSSNGGDLKFNSNGSQFAFCNLKGLLAIYNFDRCTGNISLNKTIRAEDPNGNYPYFFDCCFSPNDSLLYLSCAPYISDFDTTHIFLYQIPLTSFNPYASKTLIWNQTAPNYILGIRLAPDNKIYIASGPGGYPYDSSNYSVETMHLSVIHEPNRRGGAIACDFRPYSFYLGGKRTYWGLPNNPNYDLGPVPGSICDSLSVNIKANDNESPYTIYPNPFNNKLSLHFSAHSFDKITLKLYDLKGCLLWQDFTFVFDRELDFSKIENGVYILKIEGDHLNFDTRLVKIN